MNSDKYCEMTQMDRAPASKLIIPKSSDGSNSNVASNQIDFKFTFDNLT
jgi:hypothetical protein